MNKIKELIARVSSNEKIKKAFVLVISVLTAIYVFSIPSFSNRVTWNIVSYLAMAFLVSSSIIYIVIYKDVTFDKKTLLLPGFVLFASIGTLLFSHAFRDYLTLILMTITFYTLLVSFSIIKDLNWILRIVSLAFVAFSLYYIIHYRYDILNVSQFSGESFRLGWYFDNPNAIGTFMHVGIAASLYLAFFSTKKIDLLFLLAVILFFLIGFTTGSRTFLILSALAVVILLFFKFKKHWWIFIIILAGLITIFIILLNTPLLVTVKYRIIDTFKIFTGTSQGGGGIGSTGERILWQKYGTYFGSYHIIFGLGVNGFSIFSGTHTYTHGNFSEVLCDFGLGGFILFYLTLLIPAVLAILARKKERFFIITAVAIFLIEGFLSVYCSSKVTFVLLAICYYIVNKDGFAEYLQIRKREYYKKNKLIYSENYEIDI